MRNGSAGERNSAEIIRFGVFEVDLRTGELLKSGIRIKLSEQPFRVLAALLERPRDVVTRDELRYKIWSDNTFVDFEQGLNRSVNKVREALGDSAVNPRFIETLPGRGYRFIAPIESAVGEVVQPSPPPQIATPVKRERSRWRRNLIFGVIPVFLLMLVALIVFVPLPIPTVKWEKLTTDNYTKIPPALTDGTRVYFQATYGGDQFLAQVPVHGGQATRVAFRPPARSFALQDVSPDGQQLLLSADDQAPPKTLYSIRLADGVTHALEGIQAVTASYSPDGKHLAYSDGSKIWVADHDGLNRHSLLSVTDGLVSAVYWSSRANELRFAKRDPVTFEKTSWRITVDGTDLQRTLQRHRNFDLAGWTKAGIDVFVAPGGSLWSLHPKWRLLNSDKDSLVQLTGEDPEFLSPLRFRKDDITYSVGVSRLGELERYDETLKLWTPVLEGISAESVSYSRDGKRVAYVSYPQRTLWVRHSDGSQPVQLTSAPMAAVLPQWSPESTEIAFMGLPSPGTTCKCYIAASNGGALRLASPQDAGSQSDCSWSPDGKKLAYGLRGGSNTGEPVYIRVVDLQTKAVSKLPGSEDMFAPRWSPDGTMIAAMPWRMPSDRAGLFIYNFRAKQWGKVFDDQVDSPNWLQDSKSIMFDDGRLILRFHVKERTRKVITERKTEEVGGFWNFIGVANDGAPIRTLNRDSNQIYRLEINP